MGHDGAPMRHDARTREAVMRRAIAAGDAARLRSRPNPWVGAVLECTDGSVHVGSTAAPGGFHAEVAAIAAARAAGADTRGSVLTCTLEPCAHTGRTGPCTEAIVAAGVAEVVYAVDDPDPSVDGRGGRRLREAGLTVTAGVLAAEVSAQLAPYLHHRRTGRPWVLVKMATTLDGRTHLPHGPGRITGDDARSRVHRLRAESDAICVGAGTVLVDDPLLTVRHAEGPSPERIVLSRREVPPSARVQPCTRWDGAIGDLLDDLGARGVVQLMVEGGPTTVARFAAEGAVDRWVFHVAPFVSGDADAPGIFPPGVPEPHRFVLAAVSALGDDIEIVLEPPKENAA
ncbi:MAG: diaminohydroxyphosphoribosylaminopyrimidine deaminase [Actinomycetota bacterium]